MTRDAVLILEPDHNGHRFTFVRYVVENVGRPVILATVKGVRSSAEFVEALADLDLEVVECFDEVHPPASTMATEAARLCASRPIGQLAILDADRPLKVWWMAARPLRGLPQRPEVVFLLTRYPLYVLGGREMSAPAAIVRRGAMVACILAARLVGVLGRVAVLSQRGRPPVQGVVIRVGDPAENGAHARDRAALRARHALDPEAFVVGLFGVITLEKNPHLILEALDADQQLLLGGQQDRGVREWLDQLSADDRARVVTFEGYLSDQDLDELMAAVDVVAVVMNYDRTSGIMGKALAAGVPVISGGSQVRARELAATGAGLDAVISVDALRAGLRELAARPSGSFEEAAATAEPHVMVDALFGARTPRTGG